MNDAHLVRHLKQAVAVVRRPGEGAVGAVVVMAGVWFGAVSPAARAKRVPESGGAAG